VSEELELAWKRYTQDALIIPEDEDYRTRKRTFAFGYKSRNCQITALEAERDALRDGHIGISNSSQARIISYEAAFYRAVKMARVALAQYTKS